MLIDTHVHLQSPKYVEDLDAVLQRAAAAGVRACIVPGTDLESSRAAIGLAEHYAEAPCAVYAAVGVHPTNADALTAAALDTLHRLARHPRVVAIGEIGLDYYWPNQANRDWPCADPPQQKRALRAQLALAAEFGLPVSIHDRDAHTDTLALLRAWGPEGAGCTGTLHAYAGGPALLDEALSLGFCIGMDGPVTFDKAHNLHAVAREVPLDRLLLETDGPYLTPVPHRGKRNEPAYLTHIAAKIAVLRGTTPEAIKEATTRNAIRLLGLPTRK
jgi:TatD DNase family protein